MHELSLNCSENRTSRQRAVRQTATAWSFSHHATKSLSCQTDPLCDPQTPERASTRWLAGDRIHTDSSCGPRNYYRGTLHWYWSMHKSPTQSGFLATGTRKIRDPNLL